MIKNIIVRDVNGEFDYQVEGVEFEIIEVFEDGIQFINMNDELVTYNCEFDGDKAIINM